MAFDAYLKIEGIPGEALDAQFKDPDRNISAL
ncbi:type VI secretion system tube protein Hcp [Pseudomonas syringae]|jgi:type VI secretion system secreted protein Hcp|nr:MULTISPECIES: type VI secretion system tube protein Hcp [Pseudomonas]MBP1141411.1 type VI protein secretion system component Hcp [Pseudomonas sp. PvP009]MDF5833747.1 type VI secretion system tube protein Hcp [Pseudomonas syringae]UOF21416.1 type VI secretion system tube protein Hcp [Pseudomonas syringae CC440]UZS69154.1 type VI secretion system tube protein Hcp [Pseudomonas syringae]